MKRDERREVLRALGLVTQLGFTMGCCVLVGVLMGKYLDRWLGTSPWLLLIFAVVGALSAFKHLYDVVIREWMDDDGDKK